MAPTVHRFVRFILLLAATISLAAAVPSIGRRSTGNTRSKRDSIRENSPWYLSHIVAYSSYANSTRNSSISFNVHDENAGLQLNTTCSITFGKGVEPDTGDGWAQCRNNAVKFQYTAGAIGIQRSWKDDSFGPPPWNIATCFGSWQTSFHEFHESTGIRREQGCMEVYCTVMD